MRCNHILVPLLAGAIGLSGCAGPVETRTGVAGTSPVTGGSITAVNFTSSENDGEVAAAARSAIQAALLARGLTTSPDAPSRLTFSVAERPAEMAILDDEGRALSSAKRQRLLQNCADKTHRLLLALQSPGQAPVRVWAEESHCNGTLAASIPALAKQAVEALYRNSGSITLRKARD